MIRGENLKYIAVSFLLLFVFQITFPTISLALTGGPSSPETNAFTPVGASELVDLSTGDFSYNIPLMTVPGPNGGYPINIGYKAGVTMEQEASWVGLGWDLNVGSINRNLRGLPDDFNGDKGDKVTQELTYKPTVISSATFAVGPLGIKFKEELFGKEVKLKNVNYTVGFNNYTGVSGGIGKNFNVGNIRYSANLDSKDGINVSASLGTQSSNFFLRGLNLSAGFSTLSGFSSINFSRGLNLNSLVSRMSVGLNFAKLSPIGEINSPQDITTTHLGYGQGRYDNIEKKYREKINFRLANTTVSLKAKTQNINAYGYMNLEYADENGLMDFHKENELSVYDESPVLPMPVLDNDVYSISGQGVSGSFRAYRGDIPMLQSHHKKTKKTTIGGTGEFGGFTHVGGDAIFGSGEGISGKWGLSNSNYHSGNIEKLEDDIVLEGNNTDYPLYRPFYFDYMGNQTMSDDSFYDDIEQNKYVGYDVSLGQPTKVEGMWSKFGILSSPSFNRGIKTNLSRDRSINTNHIGYFTKKEIANSKEYHIQKNIGNDNHIHEIAVTNTSGMKYVYGIPVYNKVKEDVMFSVSSQSVSSGNYVHTDSRVDYGNSGPNKESSLNNKVGNEHFYKSTKIENYAHSYLLTATYSDDYVDLTHDGPSDDDFGYWCKFEYEKVSDYNWRAPFYGANYEEGNHSNMKDDKASFTFGTKEQYYVKKIETKTHIAIFTIDDRKDNCGAADRDQISTSNVIGAKSKKLVNIKLYSKQDLTKPIKEVRFYYDYSQCKGVENYDASVSGANVLTNTKPNSSWGDDGGKLTLRKVVIINQDNSKGELAPYEFEYGDGASQGSKGNNDYVYLDNTDRWGVNQEVPSGFASSKYFPYTNQYLSTSDRNKYASNWNLTQIKLPSKGSIEVEYESDDYSKVQEKEASQMYEIVGFGLTDNPDLTKTKRLRKLNEITGLSPEPQPKQYVLFKKTDGTSFKDDNEVARCLKDQSNIFFKAYLQLKSKAPEFVSGYFRKAVYTPKRHSSDPSIGVFKIENSKYGRLIKDIHPAQKIACQHYHDRGDLQSDIQSPIKQLRVLVDGPVAYYQSMGVGRKLSSLKKSIVRLGLDSKEVVSDYLPSGSTQYDRKKYGGGIRVKSVRVSTGWGETYGQKYSYVKEDGTTSGVADYEPIIGGEENPYKQPIVYNKILDYNSTYGTDEFFTEGPFSEAFYPSAVVKYSRVITESLTPKDINPTETFKASNLGGITVNGYYTSEDFPVIENYSGIDKSRPYNKRSIAIPFGLDKPKRNSRAFSQGFVVELNDMSGKPKYVATYNYADKSNLILSNAKTKVLFTYHTDSLNPKKLDGKVKVLTQDGEFDEATIGRKEEFYVYQHENFDFNIVKNINANIGYNNIFSKIDYIYPEFSRNRSIEQQRMLVTNKVIYHTGILKEIETNNDGKITVSKNLAYDVYTGRAVVQSQNNDWDKPVYSYNYSGSWKYPELAGKYKNYRARFKVKGSSPNYSIDAPNVNVGDVLQVGDLIKMYNGATNCYVTKVDVLNNTFDARNLDNSPAGNLTIGTATVMQSGYRNLQEVSIGNIVSLDNPLDFPFSGEFVKRAFQNIVTISNPANVTATYYDTIKCDTIDYNFDSYYNSPVTSDGIKTYSINVNVKNDTTQTCPLIFSIIDDEDFHSTNVTYDPNSLKKTNNGRYTFNYTISGVKHTGIIYTECDLGCPLDVLHASATELADTFSYNYSDIGSPVIKTDFNSSTTTNLSASIGNDYAFGKRGKWKAHRSWVNQIDRKQKGTKGHESEIDTDGEYETFRFFKWGVDTPKNQKFNWDWTTNMTKYSPYGYDLENKNPLDVYSSELYGYDNSLVTAVGANASYNEIASDNFETNNTISTTSTHQMTGHFKGTVDLFERAHTGKYSMIVGQGTSKTIETENMKFEKNKKYLLSFWVLAEGASDFTFEIIDKQTSTSIKTKTYNFNANDKAIDGFLKIDIDFVNSLNDMNNIEFKITAGNNGSCIMDDIRIQPSEAAFKAFVYDPVTLKLISELDNLNFATFYNYDEEGKLVQVKKETVEGVFTVQSSKDNIAH